MSREYTIYQVDAFTKEKFRGNPAGVVTCAEGLSEFEMQMIARELNNSETAFVFYPSNSIDHDLHIRFFTPTQEVPICGHATIAAHYVIAQERNLATTRVRQKCGIGILPVDIIKEQNGDYKIAMTQNSIVFGDILEGEVLEKLLESLHIQQDNLYDNVPVQIVSTGYAKVIMGIKSRELLNRLSPDMAALIKISRIINCNGFYLFTMDSPDDNILTHGRMFAPISGINEDPVTGNASGPLGGYLIQYGLVAPNHSSYEFAARQGEAMNRMGTVYVKVKLVGQTPQEVSIAGSAAVVFKTRITLD